jgi:uncharacterized protein YcbK (DUF882 family)
MRSRKKRISRAVLGAGLVLVLMMGLYGIKNYLGLWSRFFETQQEPEYVVIVPEPRKLRNDHPYSLHLDASEHKIPGGIKDDEELERLKSFGRLVEVKDAKGYTLMEQQHGKPYLLPEAAQILKEIGLTFDHITQSKHFFTVTSTTRTIESQKKLQRSNINATTLSAHSFGNAFDISYIRFDGVKDFNYELKKQLELVLADFQFRKKILVIKERKQSCYHITCL